MLLAIVKFARLRVTFMLWALVFVGCAATTGSISTKALLSIFVLVAWYIHATTINDYADLAIDKINLKKAPDRPLLGGGLSFRQLWILHFSSGVLALALCFMYGRGAALLMVVMLLINYAYSLRPTRLSDRGLWAQLLLAFAYAYLPFSLGFWSSDGEQFPWLLTVGIFLAFVARTLLKDFRDREGDKKHGKETFLLRHGTKSTVFLSATLWLAAALLLGYFVNLPGFNAVLVLALIQVLALLVLLYKGLKHNEEQVTITFIAKAANALIITLLVFLLSRNQPITVMERQFLVLASGGVLLIFNWLRYVSYRSTVTTPRSASTSTS